MQNEKKVEETPEAFLDALGASLNNDEGGDANLTEILKAHILKTTPAQNAVVQAKDAILKLAGERASPPKPEVANG